MRVTDKATARNYLKYLNKANSDYAKTNERIASGNRFTDISDDVSSGARVLRARSDRYKVDKQLDNVKGINEELATAEDAMGSIITVLADIHQKIVKIKTDTTGDDRKILANELKNMQTEILAFSNTMYGSKYVFGGTNAAGPPFSVDKETNELLYNGIKVNSIEKDKDGYFYMKEEKITDADGTESSKFTRTAIPMDGDSYMDIGLGIKMNGPNVDPSTGLKVSYSGLEFMGFGKDEKGLSNNLFNTITEIIQYTNDYEGNAEKLATQDTKLTELTDKFRVNQTEIGSKTNFLNVMQEKLEKSTDSYTLKIKNLMGTDELEESTNQSMNDYVLKAVIQMGARILPVSLMDYLR